MKKLSAATATAVLVAGVLLGVTGTAQAAVSNESSHPTQAKCLAERKLFIQEGYTVTRCHRAPSTTGVERWAFWWNR